MVLGNYFKPREYSFEVKHADVKKSLDINAAVIIDRQTGVNYLFALAAARGGLTPLLNADGSIVITPIDEE